MTTTRWIAATFAGLLLILAGCSGGGNPAEPPSGWEATETRMWQQDVDTSEVFRNLESLESMGVLEGDVTLSQGNVSQEQFKNAIKRSLIALYRNDPTTVDSLFEEYAAPKLEEADLSGNIVEEGGELKPKILNKYKKMAYEAINEHYREPQQNQGASNIAYPESLRTEETSGRVELQAHVNADGQIDAIEVVESVHPTLDAIAMKAAATESKWRPAQILRDGEWVPTGSWVRFGIPYPAPRG